MKYSKGFCGLLTAFALLVLPMLSVFSISHALAGEGKKNSFRDDVAFLEKYVRVVVLLDKSGQAQVAVVPAYQGRVMTSTAAGPAGLSFGWINYGFIASGTKDRHMNVYGGEDRLWLGPEGGQFSIFFAQGAAFDLEHWVTPAPLDTEPFEVAGKSPGHVRLLKKMHLTNYSGTK